MEIELDKNFVCLKLFEVLGTVVNKIVFGLRKMFTGWCKFGVYICRFVWEEGLILSWDRIEDKGCPLTAS
jgi:hypothetical protein